MADKRIVTVDYLNSEGLNKGYINNTFANALKGSKSDTAILIDDVSPVTHNMGVKVRGKNLCVDVSDRTDVFFSGSPTTTYSITGGQIIKGFAVNGNATNYHITDFVNSNGTVSFKTNNASYTIGIDVRVVQGETYTVSANITGGAGGSSPIWITFLKDGLFQSYTTAQSFTVPNNCNQAILLIRPSAANTECSFSNVQLELGTTATAYTPYVPDLTAVKVTRCGKNLLSAMSLYQTVTNNAVPIHFKAGQKYTISFTTTYTAWRLMFFGTDKNGAAFDNSKPDANKYISGMYTGTIGRLQHASNQSGNTLTFTCNEDCTITAITFWNVASETDKTYSDFQLEIGSTATDYEPYKECAEYTPNADGTVEGVTSLYPNTTLVTDTEGVLIDCEYNRDINKAFAELQQAIISLGGNV